MKIAFLTPGTGSYYCGACMRDNTLAKSLRQTGHRVSLLPMYLPLQLDESALENSSDTPIFFGGINIFLQQKYPLFRHTPAWVDHVLDSPRLLRGVARRSHMTSAANHGEMTLAMLRPENQGFGKESEKLIRWLEQENPDLVCLSTALQAGMIRGLKQRLGAKIVCCFQGEDGFLDGLPQPYRDDCWAELAVRIRDADALIAPSRFYAGLIRQRLGTDDLPMVVLPNGIDLTGYQVAPRRDGPPAIGFFARMCRDKGIETMVEAFIHLCTELSHPDATLHLAGAVTADDRPLIERLKKRLAATGLNHRVRWSENVTRREKAAMLSSLHLFSVPATCQEAFGIYLIEAMASGVPVVQPDSASFPEILGSSGAGKLVPPGDPAALAAAWHQLLQQPDELARMAENSRRAAENSHDVSIMRDRFLAILRDTLGLS